ncbi:MAG TPA: hypothetical protein VGZ03_08770 [Acidimicrobiales bacterium]|nr:hypothetical protein [Acidimicrobiales bacterium]
MSARVLVVVLLAGTLLAGCGTSTAPPPDGTGAPAISQTVTLSALACEPLAWCVAAGTDPASTSGVASIEVSAGGRGRWAPSATPPLPSTTLSTAACWTSGCLLGGAGPSGSVVVIVNPARKVASITSAHPPGSGIAALTCTAPARCLALVTATTDTAVFATTDSGASWTQRASLPAGLAVATAASCANPADCVAVGTGPGGSAAAARSVDGGVRWRLAITPRGLQTYTSVTCGSPRWCLATARRPNGTAILLASTDGGLVWSAMATTIPSPAAVTCANVPTCVVAGGGAAGGEITVGVRTAHARPLTLVYVPDQIVAVGCATPVKCAAITPASTVSFVG